MLPINFTLRHIRYFCAVAEQLHFRRAAEQMHIAQPAISRAIAQLERELGVQLFERNNRKVVLTIAGSVFLESCHRIQKSIQESVVKVRKAESGNFGQIVVGYTDFAIMGNLPQILKTFRQQHPDVSVTSLHSVTASQLEDVANDKIDIGFVTGPLAIPDFHFKTVQEDKFVVVLYHNHPLASQETISLAQLKNERFILGNTNYWQHYHDHLYRICRRTGFTMNVVQHAYNSEAIFGLVACEMGITIHASCASNYIRKGLVIRNIDDITDTLPTQAVWKKNAKSPVTKVFAQLLNA